MSLVTPGPRRRSTDAVLEVEPGMDQTVEQQILVELQELNRRFDGLHSGLMGSSDAETEHGRVPRLERKVRSANIRNRRLAARVRSLEIQNIRAKAYIAGVGSVAGAAAAGVVWFIKWLFERVQHA